MNNWEQFIIGFVGSLIPEVIRMYKIKEGDPSIKNWPFYIIISLIYGTSAGLVTNWLNANNVVCALYTGLCFPTVISNVIKYPDLPGKHSTGKIANYPIISYIQYHSSILTKSS